MPTGFAKSHASASGQPLAICVAEDYGLSGKHLEIMQGGLLMSCEERAWGGDGKIGGCYLGWKDGISLLRERRADISCSALSNRRCGAAVCDRIRSIYPCLKKFRKFAVYARKYCTAMMMARNVA